MEMILTHDEMTMLRIQCVQRAVCECCALNPWCNRRDNAGRIESAHGVVFSEVNKERGLKCALITERSNDEKDG